MGLVPQDPMSNLNPVHRIERQIKEALVANNVDIKREKRIVLTDVLELSEREQSAVVCEGVMMSSSSVRLSATI